MSLLSFPIFPPCLTALFRSRSAILHSHETIYKYAKQKSGEKKTFIYHITDRSIAFYWHLICFSVFFLAVALRLISLCDTVFGTFGCYFAQVRYLLLFSLNMLWIDTHLVFPFIFHSSLMKETEIWFLCAFYQLFHIVRIRADHNDKR